MPGRSTFGPYMQHVRAVSSVDDANENSFTCDVILDSGADTSALPLRFGTAGTECPSPSTSYVDAQGMPLAIASTRLAHVQFGDVVFKEKFIVSDILHLEQFCVVDGVLFMKVDPLFW